MHTIFDRLSSHDLTSAHKLPFLCVVKLIMLYQFWFPASSVMQFFIINNIINEPPCNCKWTCPKFKANRFHRIYYSNRPNTSYLAWSTKCLLQWNFAMYYQYTHHFCISRDNRMILTASIHIQVLDEYQKCCQIRVASEMPEWNSLLVKVHYCILWASTAVHEVMF